MIVNSYPYNPSQDQEQQQQQRYFPRTLNPHHNQVYVTHSQQQQRYLPRTLNPHHNQAYLTQAQQQQHHEQQQHQQQQQQQQNNLSRSNLAQILEANYMTLNHHHHLPSHAYPIFGSSGGSSSPMMAKTKLGPSGCLNCNHLSKQIKSRASHFFYEYRTIVTCSLWLIVLALVSMSVIKFGPDLTGTLNKSGGPITLPLAEPPIDELTPTRSTAAQLPKQDMLKSRLLTGEFVILSQKFSRNPSQQNILAERIVKLMDQVFLSSPDVKQLYSRMEVLSIRPNLLGGIVVNCNIILSESIAYAAQQFGLALYNSLGNSRELLAGQTGYLIDKNSIKLNSVPDKDLLSGSVPANFIPPELRLQPTVVVTQAPPSGPIDLAEVQSSISSFAQIEQQSSLEQTANQVVWSEWSDWSSCVDKNGVCDPARIHSRIRHCVAQTTGEKVDPEQCKKRYSMQDLALELSECSRSCSAQTSSLTSINFDTQSDAPTGPHTVSPILFSVPTQQQLQNKDTVTTFDESTTSTGGLNALLVKQAASLAEQQQQQQLNKAVGGDQTTASNDIQSSSSAPTLLPPSPMLVVNLQPPVGEISCSNCTSDEICLLLMQQKVPFCAKVKDRTDSCGGWCKGQNQLCQPVGSSAFKCIHDSECLPEEWRCNNGQCIPLSAHCDGHSNCYDNSDERDCPIKKR